MRVCLLPAASLRYVHGHWGGRGRERMRARDEAGGDVVVVVVVVVAVVVALSMNVRNADLATEALLDVFPHLSS